MRNTVHLGDCLEVMQQIPSGTVDMILCDLPYGTTQNKWDSVIDLSGLWAHYERVITPNGAIVLTCQQPFTSVLITSNLFLFRYEWIWDKALATGFLDANKKPLRRHESICVFYKKLPVYNPQKTPGKPYSKPPKALSNNYGSFAPFTVENESGDRFPTSILPISNANRQKNGHPTQKPVPLFEYLIKTYTNPGDLVLDNCAGSGTTGIACMNTGRDYILIEKEPDYYNIIQERIAKVKEKQASQLFAL